LGGSCQNEEGIHHEILDYIAWTKSLEKMARKDLAASLNITVPKGKELWVGESMSPLARKKFTEKGWTIKENVSELLTLK
jgi:hypothetical protein